MSKGKKNTISFSDILKLSFSMESICDAWYKFYMFSSISSNFNLYFSLKQSSVKITIIS